MYKGSSIDLVIGDGEGVQRFPTPNFVGKSLEDVKFQINASKLKLDVINFIKVDSIAPNVIYKQLPPAGSMIRSGNLIEIWVNSSEMDDEEMSGGTDDGIRMR